MPRNEYDLNIPTQYALAIEYQKKVVRLHEEAKTAVAAERAAQRPAPVLVFDGTELLDRPQWLMEYIMPAEGAGMLFGETDLGKTFVALSMGIAISAGVPWMNIPVAQGTVLFIEAEGGRNFALRKHAAKEAAGLIPLTALPFVTVYESLVFGPKTDMAFVLARAAQIREEVAAHGHPPTRFVVTDTLAQNIQGDVDSNEDMTAFLKLFRAFLKALSAEPVFGLLIHHPGHAEKARGRGAYSLPADLDLILHLEGKQEELTLTCDRLRVDKKFAPISLALESRVMRLDDESVTSTLVVVPRMGTTTGQRKVSHEEQIITYLMVHPGKTTSQITDELGITKQTVVKIVDALVERKVLVRHTSEGKKGQKKQVYEVASSAPVDVESEANVHVS